MLERLNHLNGFRPLRMAFSLQLSCQLIEQCDAGTCRFFCSCAKCGKLDLRVQLRKRSHGMRLTHPPEGRAAKESDQCKSGCCRAAEDETPAD